jgi:hypothetical protein
VLKRRRAREGEPSFAVPYLNRLLARLDEKPGMTRQIGPLFALWIITEEIDA